MNQILAQSDAIQHAEILGETDRSEGAAFLERTRQFRDNSKWFRDHIDAIRREHAGMAACVGGKELFVAETAREALALARAAHPDDRGPYVEYVRPVPRIFLGGAPLRLNIQPHATVEEDKPAT
jgi:hypothetical protein